MTKDDNTLMLATVGLCTLLTCVTIFRIEPCSRDKKPKEPAPIIYPQEKILPQPKSRPAPLPDDITRYSTNNRNYA